MLRQVSFTRGGRFLWLFLLASIGVTALGYDSSVTVEARWHVLPYQSLRLTGAGSEASLVSISLPAATEADLERGYTEDLGAIRLHVASNTAWKVQLRLADSDGGGLEARETGAEYVGLSITPMVLASGPLGVYDVSVDVRRLFAVGEGISDLPIRLIATIMPE
jgi:hypothetical protein